MVRGSESQTPGWLAPPPNDSTTRTPCCGYCGGEDLQVVFFRNARRYVRCTTCRAILQAPPMVVGDDPDRDALFVATIDDQMGGEADYSKWREFERHLCGRNLLEIGPGTGHFLAAARDAGFSVMGIEPDRHLREYIRKRWNIETTAELLEKNALAPSSFDNVVTFNCIEHVADPMAHVAAAYRVLKPGGRFLVSTCNANCLVERIVGRYWSMIKEVTHLSIPSAESLRAVGWRAGLVTIELWCSEYPLETPAGIALAARDWLVDRRHHATDRPERVGAAGSGRCPGSSGSPSGVHAGIPPGRRALWRLLKAKQFKWLAAVTSHFMLAGSLKALYEKPEAPPTR